MTTVRSFAVVRNWANKQNEKQSDEVSSLQMKKILCDGKIYDLSDSTLSDMKNIWCRQSNIMIMIM